ncbi:MAG: 5-(carboxyamino)imidazole ribonucleotide synthase [Acidimicrobiia bacterium]
MERSHRLGVVGAGQLGRMMHQAAIGLGVDLHFLAETDADPAIQVAPSWELGSAMHDVDLARFSFGCEVVTFEHEVVDLEGLEDLERGGSLFRPSSRSLRVVADKLGMRRAVEWAGLPVPAWKQARTPADIEAAMEEWPEAVIKLSRGGYDGRGVFVVNGVEEGRGIAERLLGKRVPLLVEPLLAFEREIAVIVARRPGGDTGVYDPVTTLQIDGQCRQVTAPSGLSADLEAEARRLGQAVASSIDVVGLVAIEMFVVDGALLINELAVRPHNSGHHTIDACVTSQFENHLRAVLDLPLGDPTLRQPAAMVNLIGSSDPVDPRSRLSSALALDPAARIHLYGKEPRPDRKIGHVTVCDDDVTEAAARAWAVVEALGGQPR